MFLPPPHMVGPIIGLVVSAAIMAVCLWFGLAYLGVPVHLLTRVSEPIAPNLLAAGLLFAGCIGSWIFARDSWNDLKAPPKRLPWILPTDLFDATDNVDDPKWYIRNVPYGWQSCDRPDNEHTDNTASETCATNDD